MRTTRPFALPLVLLLATPLLAQDPVANVRTTFDPRLDGMPFVNLGDYSAPGGNCFGMSLVAVDNFLRRMRSRAEGRPDPEPSPITSNAQDGNTDAQILASFVQSIATIQDDNGNSPYPTARPNDTRMMREALERMRRTGEPEFLGMWARDGSSHSTVVFGYEDGSLLVYDPNYPGETIRWPWDPVRGFGAHPRLADNRMMYGPQKKYDAVPFGAYRTSREMQALRDACAQGLDRCLARFHDLRGRLEGTPQAPFISGNVGNPGVRRNAEGNRPARPRRVYVVVNGTPVASGPVRPDGGFRFPLGRPVPMGARVQLVATTGDGLLAGANDLDPAQSRTRGLAGSVPR